MIRVDIQGKSFGGKQILGRVAFDIAAGEAVALLGPSGIGKTTILRIVAGTDTAFQGSVTRPDDTAIVFQQPTLLPWRSVAQNLRLVHPGLSGGDVGDMLARVGLSGKEDSFPGQLSLGQQRRLALARAFAGQPAFLIMDEPFVSLDPETAEQMLRLTEDLLRDTRPAMLFVTHAREEADRLAGRILHLAGSPATLRG